MACDIRVGDGVADGRVDVVGEGMGYVGGRSTGGRDTGDPKVTTLECLSTGSHQTDFVGEEAVDWRGGKSEY